MPEAKSTSAPATAPEPGSGKSALLEEFGLEPGDYWYPIKGGTIQVHARPAPNATARARINKRAVELWQMCQNAAKKNSPPPPLSLYKPFSPVAQEVALEVAYLTELVLGYKILRGKGPDEEEVWEEFGASSMLDWLEVAHRTGPLLSEFANPLIAPELRKPMEEEFAAEGEG